MKNILWGVSNAERIIVVFSTKNLYDQKSVANVTKRESKQLCFVECIVLSKNDTEKCWVFGFSQIIFWTCFAPGVRHNIKCIAEVNKTHQDKTSENGPSKKYIVVVYPCSCYDMFLLVLLYFFYRLSMTYYSLFFEADLQSPFATEIQTGLSHLKALDSSEVKSQKMENIMKHLSPFCRLSLD